MPSRSDRDDISHFGVKLEYDKDFRGPRSKRSCTDVICLLLFVAFLAGWGFVAYFAFRHGDIDRILVPTDSMGKKCGVDKAVLDKPYLVFFDLTKCIDPRTPVRGCQTPQVCVERCPQTNFNFERSTCNANNLADIKKQLICTSEFPAEAITSCDQIQERIDNDQCAKWHLKSDSLTMRCIPMIVDVADLHWDFLNQTALMDAINNVELLANIYGEGQKVVGDIITSGVPIGVALLVAMFCCLIVITMMRWLAGPLLWLSMLGVIGLLAFCVYYTQMQYRYFLANPPQRFNSPTNLQAIFDNYMQSKTTWLVLLILVSIVLVILLLVLLVLRKRIQIAIALVKEGSKAVSSAYTTVFFPIFPWVLQIATITFSICVLMLLISVGDPKHEVTDLSVDEDCKCTGPALNYVDGASCDPQIWRQNCHTAAANTCRKAFCMFKFVEQPPVVPYFHAVNVVGFFWLIFFVSAFGEMVLASVFATWFWSFKKSSVPFFTITRSVYRTIRYHLGTIAFGALILTICRLIRVILAYVQKKLKMYDNPVTRGILCCLQCFFWCLEKFLMFLNKNAYIMCAIHGTNFCSSAKDAFELLMRNMLRVFALNQVTSFLFFMAKLLVTLGVGASMYFYLTGSNFDARLNYTFVPPIIVMIGTYLISTVFFSVYSMAVDTLFLCFLEDSERNDGSKEKPYFMSKNLMQILDKQNAVARHHYYE